MKALAVAASGVALNAISSRPSAAGMPVRLRSSDAATVPSPSISPDTGLIAAVTRSIRPLATPSFSSMFFAAMVSTRPPWLIVRVFPDTVTASPVVLTENAWPHSPSSTATPAGSPKWNDAEPCSPPSGCPPAAGESVEPEPPPPEESDPEPPEDVGITTLMETTSGEVAGVELILSLQKKTTLSPSLTVYVLAPTPGLSPFTWYIQPFAPSFFLPLTESIKSDPYCW